MRDKAMLALLGAFVVMLLPGCANDRSENAVRSLTNSFFEALEKGDIAKAEGLADGAGGAMRPLINAAREERGLIPSYTVVSIHKVDGNTAQVVVHIPDGDLTTKIALVARRMADSWRFDSSIQIETRLNSVANAEPPSETAASK